MIIIILFILLYLLLIHPKQKNKNLDAFKNHFFAHRGYFDNVEIIENTISSFENALNNKFAIELDVQLTKDEKLIVFHDDNLLRMCNINKKVSDCTYEELKQYKLLNTNSTIPLFSDVLNTIAGKIPIIVEIKPEGDYIKASKITFTHLENYHGIFCIESFNPFVVEYFKNNHPNIIRGQLSTNFFIENKNLSLIKKVVLTNLLLNFKSKPHFIAYEYKYLKNISVLILKHIFNISLVVYTIKNKKELSNSKQCDIVIFDSFNPYL